MYKVCFTLQGKISLSKLDRETGQRILDKLKWLVDKAKEVRHLALERRLAGLYKLKVGKWRVIYEVNHQKEMVTVHKVAHRKEIYKEIRIQGG
jgi:mRNA interferase RelE/StbE